MPSTSVQDIQLLLNDQGVFWPLQRVVDALNEAQWELWSRSKWNWTSSPLTLPQGSDIIPLPSSIVIPRFVEDGKLRYFPSTQRELENFHRTWRLDQEAPPMYFIVWDAFHLRVFPKPDKLYTSYTLWGIGYPPEIVDASSNLEGDPFYIKAINSITLAILFEATRPDLADYHRGIGEKQFVMFEKNLRNYQSHNIRRFRPGGRFDLQQSGRIQELPVYYPVEC